MKVAILGSRGIPAEYGGFETLVEKLVEELSAEIDITVYCSSKYYSEKRETYKGAKLKYLNIGANNLAGIFYDLISLILTLPKFDKVIMLGAPAGVFFPLFGKWNQKIIFNYGGLDFNRNKWNRYTQIFIKMGKDLATKYAGQVVSDNKGIKDFLISENNRESTLIPYGADHVLNPEIKEADYKKYPFLNNKYALVVARIQKDNNIETIIKAFINNPPMPLVVIGNWSNSNWGNEIWQKYNENENIILLDAIYDQIELDKIRNSCYLYIHGHSAGGTNPSLVEAMYMGLSVIAFNSIFNRYTTHGIGLFFNDTTELNNIIRTTEEKQLKQISEELKLVAIKNYTWKSIASAYKKLILS